MAGKNKRDFGRETRDTVVKSTLTGVGLTVLAVAALSPAGFGGMIGSSVASALGNDHAASAKLDPYANLPPYPTLLTHNEIDTIQGELAATAAAMEITRAATDDRIELVRELAEHPNALSVAPVRHLLKSNSIAPQPQATVAPTAPSTPVVSASISTASAPAQAAVVAPQESVVSAPAPIAPISFIDSPLDPNVELASLLLGAN